MKILFYSIIFLIFTGCGYTVISKSENIKYNIINVEIEGEKRINYFVKNKLLTEKIAKKENQNIDLFIKTTKNKSIKEKNIKNEITKYEISLTSVVEVKKFNKNKVVTAFSVSNNGDYSVADQNSLTRNNEKNLTKALSENLAKKIILELNLRMNDL